MGSTPILYQGGTATLPSAPIASSALPPGTSRVMRPPSRPNPRPPRPSADLLTAGPLRMDAVAPYKVSTLTKVPCKVTPSDTLALLPWIPKGKGSETKEQAGAKAVLRSNVTEAIVMVRV